MSEFEQLARDIAVAHGLQPELVCAVCEQESGWNNWAIRFEPAFKAKYVDPLGLSPTEGTARSFSWGLMQLMGEVARELGYKDNLAKLCDPATGLEWGCRLLVKKLEGSSVHDGLQRWNGGGSAVYADQVLARVAKYATPSS